MGHTKTSSSTDICTNRKAFHNFEILDTYEVGIVLYGTEIKSMRAHGASIQEAYIAALEGDLWLINASITPFKSPNVMSSPTISPST